MAFLKKEKKRPKRDGCPKKKRETRAPQTENSLLRYCKVSSNRTLLFPTASVIPTGRDVCSRRASIGNVLLPSASKF